MTGEFPKYKNSQDFLFIDDEIIEQLTLKQLNGAPLDAEEVEILKAWTARSEEGEE